MEQFCFMWSYLCILHSDTEDCLAPPPPNYFLWQTCMRNIYISDMRLGLELGTDERSSSSRQFEDSRFKGYTKYQGYRAYRFLLELVLGLHSDLLGETEIVHQFRREFQDNREIPKPLRHYLKKLSIDIIEDSRPIRSQEIYALGDLSYGGVARRILKDKGKCNIVIFGSGHLALDLLPWIKKTQAKEDKHSILLVARNSLRLNYIKKKFDITVSHYRDLKADSFNSKTVLLIVAPLVLEPYLSYFKEGMNILDFRGNAKKLREEFLSNNQENKSDNKRPNKKEKQAGRLELGVQIKYYSLKDMTSFISLSQHKREQLFERLKPIIDKCIAGRRAWSYQSSNDWDELSSRYAL